MRILRRPISDEHLALVAVIAIGAIATWLNQDLPIVRNALLYAQIHKHVAEHHGRFWEVCSDANLVFDKACGFPVLASPIIALLGANVGLKWASWLGNVAFVLASASCFRRFGPRMQLRQRDTAICILVCGLNPLTHYQFWSAYPDGLSFALFLASFVLLDRLALGGTTDDEEPTSSTVIAYPLTFMFALFIKPWAMVMFPLHAVYLWLVRDRLRVRWATGNRAALLQLLAGFTVAAAFMALGRAGLNPLLNLVSNAGQYDHPVSYLSSAKQFVVIRDDDVGPDTQSHGQMDRVEGAQLARSVRRFVQVTRVQPDQTDHGQQLVRFSCVDLWLAVRLAEDLGTQQSR